MSDAYHLIPRPLTIDYDTVHVAVSDHVEALCDELTHRGSQVVDVAEDLVFARGQAGPAAWAANTWLAPCEYHVASIGQAARLLKQQQRNWHGHPITAHRRAELIADKLPPIRFRPLAFPAVVPDAPLGAWTLRDRHRLVASPITSSAFPDGHMTFAEDRTGPPNRAYLKLWEALTLARRQPVAHQRCVDLGAAPGGWTWVLAGTGAQVIAVDRAPLADRVAAQPNVTHRQGDAFAITADDVGAIDWVCSDLIAYPERLLALVRYWCQAAPAANIILTVKCQGHVDPALMAAFRAIPDARLCHLSANKHELTFFRLAGGGPPEASGA